MNEAKQLDLENAAAPRPEPALFEATAVSLPSVPVAVPDAVKRRSGVAAHLLVFALIGLCVFAAFAGLTAAMFLGSIDHHTADLKEWMHKLKDLSHTFRGGGP